MSVANEQIIAKGAYSKKQLFCKDRIIAWSHNSRYKLAREIVQQYAGKRLLDYGCGDGTFLAIVSDLFGNATGADVDPKQTAECAKRFETFPNLSFLLLQDLDGEQHDGAFDVAICMEVLEHSTEEQVDEILTNLRRLVSRDGTVIISVPIEIGPTLLAKHLVRTVAGWRGLGDYKYREKYTVGEIVRMVFAGEKTAIDRPVYTAEFSTEQRIDFHGHKGFNWRALRVRLRQEFTITEIRFSPLGWLGGYLSSQAWFVCKPA